MIPWEHDCKTCLYNTEPKTKACEECRRDLVEVVRCKDCKWHESVCRSRRSDWYCPDGERIEDGKTN